MGLRDVFDQAAQTIFTAAGDVPETVYYYAHASAQYNVSTGVVSTIASAVVVSMVFETYKQHEIVPGHVEPTDQKAIVIQSKLGVIPTPKDHLYRIEAGASVRYNIEDKEQDPASATWVLQCRKP
jgi:hypothetical protein